VTQVFIEIEGLPDEPLHVHHVFPKGEIELLEHDAGLDEPVDTDFVLTHRAKSLHIRGTLDTTVRFACARCLKQFSRHVSTPFDLSYLPQPRPVREGDEIALKYDEMEVGFYDGIRLDVNLMVLEQIELALPMKFVCREDCRGLCVKCGADRNERDCGCDATEPDIRLGALLEFKKMKMEETH
jgi:uncharacterized protein